MSLKFMIHQQLIKIWQGKFREKKSGTLAERKLIYIKKVFRLHTDTIKKSLLLKD